MCCGCLGPARLAVYVPARCVRRSRFFLVVMYHSGHAAGVDSLPVLDAVRVPHVFGMPHDVT